MPSNTGFNQSTIDVLTYPKLRHKLPVLVDDCTLALRLRTKPRLLWWYVIKQSTLYTIHHIPKKSGGSRTIYAPDPRLKRLQQRYNRILLHPLVEHLGDHVTAYRKRRSLKDAVQQHVPACPICDQQPYGQLAKRHDCPRRGTYIHMDLTDFFPSTKRSWVRRYFRSVGYNPYVSSLLATLVTVNMPSEYNPLIGKRRVPQGAPTSGSICNLIADKKIDTPILEYLRAINGDLPPDRAWRYTRYCDDLTFTCGYRANKDEVSALIRDVTHRIEDGGYTVNAAKTTVTQPKKKHRQKRMLGLTFNHHPNINRELYRRVRAMCHNSLCHGFSTQWEHAGKANESEFRYWLIGMVAYINQVAPLKGAPLLNDLATANLKYPKETVNAPT